MIDLVDVSKSYGPGLPAVNHANLHVDKGEFVFVVGSSSEIPNPSEPLCTENIQKVLFYYTDIKKPEYAKKKEEKK